MEQVLRNGREMPQKRATNKMTFLTACCQLYNVTKEALDEFCEGRDIGTYPYNDDCCSLYIDCYFQKEVVSVDI